MILDQTGELAPADKPWQLLRDTIADLEQQEKEPLVALDMREWHVPIIPQERSDLAEGVVCVQCLAGCVMSRRLGASLADDLYPNGFQEEYTRLNAVDDFRRGRVATAYIRLELDVPAGIISACEEVSERLRKEDYYQCSPGDFKSDILALADILEKYGENAG